MQIFFYFLDHLLELGLILPHANFGEKWTKLTKLRGGGGGECTGPQNEPIQFQTSLTLVSG